MVGPILLYGGILYKVQGFFRFQESWALNRRRKYFKLFKETKIDNSVFQNFQNIYIGFIFWGVMFFFEATKCTPLVILGTKQPTQMLTESFDLALEDLMT